MKIDRLLGIIIILLNKDILSASELAKRFAVSVRTIQRDMDTLNLAGIPIYALPGQSGGYGIMPEYKINNRLLSHDDILNLITALKSVQGTFADTRFLGSLEQVYSLLPYQAHNKALERENSLYIDFSLTGNDSILAEKIRKLEQAINSRVLVHSLYTSLKQETVLRTLEPMTLILQWGSWYLFAFCRARADFRLFKISRLHDIVALQERFERRNKTYQEFVLERPMFHNERLIDLVFVAEPSARAYVEESHPSQELEVHENGSVTVRSRQPEEERLYRYLLSYGAAIRILEPIRVKEQVQELARKILKN